MRSPVDHAGKKLFASSSLAHNKDRRIGWRNLGDAREHSLQGRRSSHDLLEHRDLVDFFAKSDVFLLESLLVSFAVIDIRTGNIPTQDLSLVVAHGVVTSQEPAVTSIALAQPQLHLVSRCCRQGTMKIIQISRSVIRM